MGIIGKATINPFLFYSGKTAGYITWIYLILSLLNFIDYGNHSILKLKYISILIFFLGIIFTLMSLINLGKSTRLGLPTENIQLKTAGIYRISRNPMYIGFNFFTISSILFTLNIIIILLGIFSIIIYHFIILGEEKYLEKKFNKEYLEYKSKVRRYL